MNDPDPPKPEHSPTDSKARRVRERVMDLVADASIHAERIDHAARRLGLTPDLVNGLGDEIYDAAVTQLDVATRVLERSSLLVDRLLDLGLPKEHHRNKFTRIDGVPTQAVRLDLVVHNHGEQTASVEVEVEWQAPNGLTATTQVGQSRLPSKRDTAVEVRFPKLPEGVYPIVVRLALVFLGGRRQNLPHHEYELWIRT